MLMITWDALKRQTNLAKHGLDFADLDEAFFLASVVIPAKAGRHMAIGRLADGLWPWSLWPWAPKGCP